jgi:RHS repeat-associated protein
MNMMPRASSITRNDWNYQVLKRDFAGNNLASKLPKNAGELRCSFDKLNRKVKTSHPTYKQELLKFDPVGNLLEMKVNGKVSTYSYNYLYQLQEEKSHVECSYAYNAVHDRLSHTTDALHSILHDGKRSFTYDRRGNRTKMDDVQYVYDGLDRLVKVITPTETITYAYDAFNRRIEKKSPSCHERYLYIDQNEIGAVDSAGKIVQLRILGEGLGAEIGASVAFEFDARLYIPIHDHRGNVATLLDEEGNIVEQYLYDAYGVEERPSYLNPWRFSSKRVDPETGFVYFGRRYYDPSLGSWITSDPLGPDAGPNLYAYALCNPMMSFDLYGLLQGEVGGSNDAETPSEAQTVYVSHENGYVVFERDGEIIHPVYQEYWDLLGIYQESAQSFGYEEQQTKEIIPNSPSFLEKTWEFTKEYSIVAAESICLALDAYSVYIMLIPTPQTKMTGAGVQLGAQAGLKALKAYRIQRIKSIAAESKLTSNFSKNVWHSNTSRWLPKKPDDLLKYGYKEISHPKAMNSGHRTFQNPRTGDTVRFDGAKPGAHGHAGKDHYHRYNANGKGKIDEYLDKHGNPCPRGSDESHLYAG